eukprot:5396245-Ditylum_brightwellii.AAC.1
MAVATAGSHPHKFLEETRAAAGSSPRELLEKTRAATGSYPCEHLEATLAADVMAEAAAHHHKLVGESHL